VSERGVFAIDRGVWDHPMFRTRDPFSRREAWLWLISSAVWKSRTVFVDGKRVELSRGQLAFSIRFMAEQWNWSKSSVERFLVALKTETMIETDTGHGVTIITICKYTEYQRVSLPDRDSNRDNSGTSAGHERDKEENKENKESIAVAAEAPAKSGSLVTPEALALTEKLLVIAGHDPAFWPPGWCGAPMRVQTWIDQGWKPEIIVAVVTGVSARKRGPPANSVNFFEKPIAEEHARQAAPLPKVEVHEAETITVTNHVKPKSGVIQAADSLLERIAGFDGPSRSPPELRGPAGTAAPRLLSNR